MSDAVAEITGFWEAQLLDSLILINVMPGISVVVRSLPFLINEGAEITEMWVENSQNINCGGVMTVWQGRVVNNFL